MSKRMSKRERMQRDVLEALAGELADFMLENDGQSAMVRAFVNNGKLTISCNLFPEKAFAGDSNRKWSPTPSIEFRKVLGDEEAMR